LLGLLQFALLEIYCRQIIESDRERFGAEPGSASRGDGSTASFFRRLDLSSLVGFLGLFKEIIQLFPLAYLPPK
jgi:hypothetical protein